MAQRCRNLAAQQVGSYLGYNLPWCLRIRKAARDPERTFGDRLQNVASLTQKVPNV